MPARSPSSDMLLRRLVESGQRAFSTHPQVSHYFASAASEDACRRVERSIDRGDGPALIVGSAGTGKSLLLQTLAAKYHRRFDVVLLACARLCTRRALLQTILFELGLPHQIRDEGQLRISLLDHLLSDVECPTGLLVLIDEAQALSTTLLDELRVMTNLMRGGQPRVRLVLAGSSGLEESFAHPDLESFSQRLSARCYLNAFSREETIQFIRAELAHAQVPPESAFALDAYEAVFDATDGVPRLINQVCDRAILLACDDNQPLVDRRIVQAAWADLQQLPTAWSAASGSTGSTTAPASQVLEFGALVESGPLENEAALIEPTELDSDDDGPLTGAPVGSQKSPRDPADPFAEEFDEEEVVLDNFASWDEIVHPDTPRVENQRDNGLSTLVQAALQVTGDSREPSASAPSHLGHHVAAAEGRAADPNTFESSQPSPRSTKSWPRLRLAVVSDAASPEPASAADETAIAPAARPWNDSPRRGGEPPILIVDDELPSPPQSGPPVRRLAYQHLFSRLRSG